MVLADLTYEQVRASIARDSLADFVEQTTSFGALESWQHLICTRLERVPLEPGTRLLIHAPPQFGKTILVSERWPAWCLGKWPDLRIRLATFNVSKSENFTGVDLELMQSQEYRDIFPAPDCRVPAVAAAGAWSTAQRARANDGQDSMVALGIRGGFVSQGADLLIIDDPYSGNMEAYSPVARAGVWAWWTDTVVPRLSPTTSVVVMFHRWHVDDLAGTLLEQGGWEMMRFPAIADDEGDDPTGRAIGEPLSPRFPVAHLEEVKRVSGSMQFASLFQGLPGEKMGNIFLRHWWRFWTWATIPDDFDAVVISGDTAYTEHEANPDAAWTVFGVWGRKGANVYLLDLIRGQWGPVTIEQEFRALCRKWPQALTKLVEHKSSGYDLVDRLSPVIAGIIPVEVTRTTGSKEVRARAVSPMCEAGNVWLPDPSLYPWVQGYIDRMAAFPAGVADDVDMTSQLLKRFSTAVESIKAHAVAANNTDPDAVARARFEAMRRAEHPEIGRTTRFRVRGR